MTSSFSARKVFRIYFQHLKKYWFASVSLLLIVVTAELFSVVIPWFYKLFVDRLTRLGTDRSPELYKSLIMALVFILVVRALGWVLWRSSGFIASHVQPRMCVDLERTAFSYLLGHSHQFFANAFVGGLVKKISRFWTSFYDISDTILWRVLPLLASIGGVIFVLFRTKISLGVIVVAWFVAIFLLNWLFVKWKIRYDIERSARSSEATAALADAITNNQNIQLFNGYEHEKEHLGNKEQNYLKVALRCWRLSEWGNVVQNVLNLGIEAIVMFTVFRGWYEGTLTVGDIVLVQTYLIGLYSKMFDMGRVIRRIYEAIAEAKEMIEILELPHEIQDVKRAKPLRILRGKIEFQHVTFRYQKTRKILNDLNLTIKPHEKVAFVGASGAGKSTIVKVLFRFYDIDRGKVLIDNQSISQVTQQSLREALSLVPQEPVLFHRSLLENIRYGRRGAMDEEVIEAAKKARCHEFISNLSQGYETLVGERGIKLSGGERQRVAIARAILKNAPILVLDEATSSLDSESEFLIQEALRELMKDRTTLVIAHRLSTIMQMDRIIVVEDGVVADQGTHAELLEKEGIYQKLWNIQAGGFLVEA